MKKLALLFLGVIIVIGMQGCSIEEQEEITHEDFSTIQNKLDNNIYHFKKVYVNYGSMNNQDRKLFESLAKESWFDYILVFESSCPSIGIWNVYYNRSSASKNNEEDIVIDAEESLTISDGNAPPPPFLTPTPVYETDTAIDYETCLTNTDNQPDIIIPIDDDSPITIIR